MRSLLLIVMSVLIWLLLAAAAQQLYSADLPVKGVVLYKHGIGYFERDGSVPAGEEVRLSFKTGDMNDILKSLVVEDSGGRVSAIRYDSNESLQQQLSKYPFKVEEGEFLSNFLDRLKGARIELKLGDRPVTGTIVSGRVVEAGPDSDRRAVREQVTLLLDSGDIANYDLANTTGIRLLDPHLQEQLKQYLETLAQAKSREKRSIYVDSPVQGAHTLRLSYITPTAIWKSSYRLSLHEPDSMLEGWAIVDNTTDEDWNNVKLSVVSGRPISFISLLDTPRYGHREVVELPEDRAAGPEVYSGAVAGPPPPAQAPADGVIGGLLNPQTKAKAPSAGLALEEQTRLEPMASTVEGATGATLGELFEYQFAGPITIKANQSAMLPFLHDKVTARKLLIYTEKDGEHPVNAAELSNNTGKTLDGGPITVYDSGAYAGEALFETLKTGDKRLIGYAVDYGTRITAAFDSHGQTIREIHVKNGLLEARYAERQTRTYTIRNVDAKPKVLVIQQEGINQYSILSPEPTERTATAYRFEVKVPANGSQSLKVEQEHLIASTTSLESSTPDFLLTMVQNKQLTETGRRQLQAIADLKHQTAEVEQTLANTRSEINDLSGDQARLRQNIDSLNRVKGQEQQVRDYSAELAQNETRLGKLRNETGNLQLRKADLETQLKQLIEKLNF